MQPSPGSMQSGSRPHGRGIVAFPPRESMRCPGPGPHPQLEGCSRGDIKRSHPQPGMGSPSQVVPHRDGQWEESEWSPGSLTPSGPCASGAGAAGPSPQLHAFPKRLGGVWRAPGWDTSGGSNKQLCKPARLLFCVPHPGKPGRLSSAPLGT
jgi:hypothetical protein